MNRKATSIAVVGGGAAGLSAAIAAARILSGSGFGAFEPSVTILEAGAQPGRKICVTGNGRCNLSNRRMAADCYHSEEKEAFLRLWHPGWDGEVGLFMSSLGVLVHERRDGCLYPRTDQAQTVADALEKETVHLGIRTCCGVRIRTCRPAGGGFLLTGTGGICGGVGDSFPETGRLRKGIEQPGNRAAAGRGRTSALSAGECPQEDTVSLWADRVILASGGMVSRNDECRGDGYRIAESMGHTTVPVRPALCALHSDAPNLRSASGVRVTAGVRLLCGDRELARSMGELQITERGISGIPAFQISRFVLPGSGVSPEAEIDFLPELTPEEWERECERRLNAVPASDTLGDFLRGLVPDRIAVWLLVDRGLVREKKLRNLCPEETGRIRILRSILEDLRGKRISVTGTDGYERAQVTAGGIRLSELTPQMESVPCPGLYLAGELLDVDGICGGYNLTWAFHSGILAGSAAAQSLMPADGRE